LHLVEVQREAHHLDFGSGVHREVGSCDQRHVDAAGVVVAEVQDDRVHAVSDQPPELLAEGVHLTDRIITADGDLTLSQKKMSQSETSFPARLVLVTENWFFARG